jgi:TonB-linked SusC/RagA family outer membrane protein
MRKIILFFQIIITLLPAALYAQNKTVSGTVRDADGVLPGASVIEKGVPTNGAVTDQAGKFRLTLRGTSNAIIVRFVGDVPQTINVTGKERIDVNMSTNAHGLEEVSVVAFGKTTRITNTGAVSSINASEIREVPTANVQNTLDGRLPGFFSQQTSGQPGKDASDFFIRGVSSLNPNGNQPLIIVDDIEYTYDQLQQINVNEIESISILKDASTTAIYGIKGANGVLVVTTRRGKLGTPKINFRVEGGLQSNTITPVFLDSYQSALLINQAYQNDFGKNYFTQADLTDFQTGSDPYGHPNVNWYDEIFKKYTFQTNANLDISGGTDRVKYFISGGALDQDGNTKDFPDPRGEVNNNYYFTRYDFRSNLDLKATKTLDLRLDVTTRFTDINEPYAASTTGGGGSVLGGVYDFTQETTFTAPVLNPNGSYAYAYSNFNPQHLPTPNALLAAEGNANSKRTDYNVLFNVTQKLDDITQGLSLTGRVAYSNTDQYTTITSPGSFLSNPFPSYHYLPATSTAPASYLLNPTGSYVFPGYSLAGINDLNTEDANVQVFANYDRTFGNKNHVTGLLLFNQDARTTFADDIPTDYFDPSTVGQPAKFRGVSLRGGYDYEGKYLVDVNAAYNGTDRFAANHRYGWFPAVSLGYNLNKEDFFKDLFPAFGLFKVRGSYGLVGSDVTTGNRYIYTQTYAAGGAYNFGSSQQDYTGYYEGNVANPNVIWERQKETDLGLDMNLLKDNALAFTIDFFHNIRYDQLIVPQNISEIIGVGLPAVNVGRTQNNGFDGSIGYHNSIGKVQYSTNFVFSYAKNKILYEDEPTPAYPWLAQTGHPIGQPFGYHFEGYYTAADVAAINKYETAHGGNNTGDPIPVPQNGETIQPGDLMYQDLNHDGYITVLDERAIGNPNLPNTTLGLNLQASYKGFSVSVLFQGSFNYSFIITGTGIEPFQSQFQPIMEQAWTPATAATAEFPRLTSLPTTVNSPTFYPSDYWLVNAYYIRLKTLELRYNVPTSLLPFRLSSGSIYLSCYNLITWDNFDKYQQDPEVQTNTVGDAYINQRVVNLGVQLGF